jgi:hypothetical protein
MFMLKGRTAVKRPLVPLTELLQFLGRNSPLFSGPTKAPRTRAEPNQKLKNLPQYAKDTTNHSSHKHQATNRQASLTAAATNSRPTTICYRPQNKTPRGEARIAQRSGTNPI